MGVLIVFGPLIIDFEDLLAQLMEGPADLDATHCKRLYMMFASMACRTSVMIGKPLDTRKMREV